MDNVDWLTEETSILDNNYKTALKEIESWKLRLKACQSELALYADSTVSKKK